MAADRTPTSDAHADTARPMAWWTAAQVLLGVPLLATIAIATIRGSRHFSWDWPTHAHHHLLANIATASALAVVSLVVLRRAMRQREVWAWWALLVAGAAIFGGYWLGNVTVGYGEGATVPNTAQSVLTVLYAAGLVAAARMLWAGPVAPPARPAGTTAERSGAGQVSR